MKRPPYPLVEILGTPIEREGGREGERDNLEGPKRAAVARNYREIKRCGAYLWARFTVRLCAAALDRNPRLLSRTGGRICFDPAPRVQPALSPSWLL